MKSAIINNKYRIIKIIGQNPWSETYLAKGKGFASFRRYVIKKFRPILGNPRAKEMKTLFEREASVLRLLSGSNPQIPQLYEYFVDGEDFYLVREWIRGKTLKQKIIEEGKLPESEVKQILNSILSVLKYIHKYGIVYRQLSPTSIVLRQGSSLTTSQQLDCLPVPIYFGGVKELARKSQKPDRANLVVAHQSEYFLPEAELEISPYSGDLYSLGLTAIYLLTAKNPAAIESNPYTNKLLWRKYCPRISTNLARAIDRAISPNPQERFSSAEAMLQSMFPKAIDLSTRTITSDRKSWLTTEVKIISSLSLSACGILGVTFAWLNFDLARFLAGEDKLQSQISLPVNVALRDSLKPNNQIAQPQLNLPAFRVGVPLEIITNSLGEPTYQSKGYWDNTRAFLYKGFADRQVDLGYLSDVETETIRQTEVSFAESIEGVEIQHFLQQLLLEDYTTEIARQVERIIDRQSDKEQFQLSNLEGTIQRNAQNRIYLAVWETGFHQ